MSATTIRVLLAVFAVYMVWKSATAPKRGAFLTLFGNVRPDQPRAFRACLICGYGLAVVLLLAAIFTDAWLPPLIKLQGI